MPGLTYLGEVLFSFGAVVLYCISFLISICSYIAISNQMEEKGMKSRFIHFKKRFVPAVSGALMGVFYQQQDSSTMNSALKGIVAGVMMAGISTVLTFLGF